MLEQSPPGDARSRAEHGRVAAQDQLQEVDRRDQLAMRGQRRFVRVGPRRGLRCRCRSLRPRPRSSDRVEGGLELIPVLNKVDLVDDDQIAVTDASLAGGSEIVVVPQAGAVDGGRHDRRRQRHRGFAARDRAARVDRAGGAEPAVWPACRPSPRCGVSWRRWTYVSSWVRTPDDVRSLGGAA